MPRHYGKLDLKKLDFKKIKFMATLGPKVQAYIFAFLFFRENMDKNVFFPSPIFHTSIFLLVYSTLMELMEPLLKKMLNE